MVFLPRYEDWPDHLTPLYARAAVAAGGASVQVSESISLSAVADPHVVVSSIDGTPLKDFSFIFGYFRAAATTPAATDIRAELSSDGTVFRTSYTAGSYDKTADNAGNQAFLSVRDSGGVMYGAFVISNIRGAAPTTLRAREFTPTSPFTSFVGHSVTSVEDQAIRFFTGAATSNWSGGTLELFGVTAAGAPTIQTHDFGVTSGANKDFTLPPGHIVASVYVNNCTTSLSGEIRVQVGTGDVFLSGGSDYRQAFMNAAAAGSLTAASFSVTDTATTGHSGWGEFWGFGNAVPISGVQAQLNAASANPSILGGCTTPTSPSSFDQVRVLTTAGVINFGVVTVISWPGSIDIETVDFGVSPAATNDFTNLDNFPIVVMAAPLLTTAAVGAAFLRTSTDGISFDSGVTDYRFMFAHDSFDDAGQATDMDIAPSTGATAQAFYSLMGGFGKSAYLVQEAHEISVTVPLLGANVRDVAQVNTALQLANSAAALFNAGKVYRMGISF